MQNVRREARARVQILSREVVRLQRPVYLTVLRQWFVPRLANDSRPGRLLDSEIIIDFKILISVVLRSVPIVSIIGWNRLELGNRVQKSGRDYDR